MNHPSNLGRWLRLVLFTLACAGFGSRASAQSFDFITGATTSGSSAGDGGAVTVDHDAAVAANQQAHDDQATEDTLTTMMDATLVAVATDLGALAAGEFFFAAGLETYGTTIADELTIAFEPSIVTEDAIYTFSGWWPFD